MRNVTGTNLRNVRVYADASPGRYAVLIVNVDGVTTARTFSVQLANAPKSSFTATQTTYGKAQYDQSKTNVWAGPVTQSLGTVKPAFDVTVPPWSISLVTLQ